MEECLMSICRRGKYHNCPLYTFLNPHRLGTGPQIQLAKMLPYMCSIPATISGWLNAGIQLFSDWYPEKGGKSIFRMYLENCCFPRDDS